MVAPANKRILLESDKAAANGLATLDGSAKVPDGQLPTRLADATLNAAYGRKWKANTAYALGEPVLSPAGDPVTPIAAFTSGATYDPTKWKPTPGSEALQLTPKSFGAKGDGRGVSGYEITAGASVVGKAASFTAADVGKAIALEGAGPGGATLVTTITAFGDVSHVTVAATASTTVLATDNKRAYFGADDTAALQAWVTYLTANGVSGYLPRGVYLISARLNFAANPFWGITGEHRGSTVIMQMTDNQPIFYLGSSGSSMHSYKITDVGFDYTGFQPAANTGANPVYFNVMPYEGSFERLSFYRGAYAMRVASGVGCPWGTTFDQLHFYGDLSLGAMDWTLGVNGVPNNKFGRIFVDGKSMTATIFAGIRGYNFVIDCIEFIGVANGVTLFQLAAGGKVTIGSMKLENGTYSSNKTLFDFQTNSHATIGQLTVGGNAMVVSSGTVTMIATNGTGSVDVGFVDALTTTLTGAFYIGSASAPLTIGRYTATNITGLQNNGGSASGNYITVRTQANRRLSDDKGDADYTIVKGDPCLIHYGTALTAPRTVTLPTDGDNLFNGLTYEVIVNGAVNGANTLTIKASTTPLRVQSTDKAVIGYTYRRHPSPVSGWILTKYETLP